VEILSPERPDTAQKVVEHLAGVRLVLVVDPAGRTISAHRLNGVVQSYDERGVVPCDDALPAFNLRVAEVFEM
jgi:Uma2 family endonuclease